MILYEVTFYFHDDQDNIMLQVEARHELLAVAKAMTRIIYTQRMVGKTVRDIACAKAVID